MARMLKNILMLTLVLAFAMLTHAASDSKNQVAIQDSTIRFWVMNNAEGSQKIIKKLLKKFKRESGISVSVEFLEWGDALEKIEAALGSQNSDSIVAPDLLQLGSTWVAHFASEGKISKLDSMMTQIDSTRFFDEFFKSTHILGKEGVYSLPWFIDIRGLYANEKIWNNLGFVDGDVNSYSEFLGLLRAVSKKKIKNDSQKIISAFSLPGKEDWTGPQHIAPFIWSFGGSFIRKTETGYTSALLDSTTLAGLSIYAKILGDKELSPNSTNQNSVEIAQNFIQSEQLLLFGTSEIIRQLEVSVEDGGLSGTAINKDGLIIIQPPKGPEGRYVFIGGSHLALPVNHKPEAKKLLAFLLRADNIDAFSHRVGFLPADKNIISIWSRDVRYSQLIKSMSSSKSFPNIPEWSDVEAELINFSNAMGALFAKTEPSESRNLMLADLLLQAHLKINAILKNKEEINKEEKLLWIAKQISNPVEEIFPQSMQDFHKESILPKVIILIALFLFICVSTFYGIRRFRK